jgi:hypothetical protein
MPASSQVASFSASSRRKESPREEDVIEAIDEVEVDVEVESAACAGGSDARYGESAAQSAESDIWQRAPQVQGTRAQATGPYRRVLVQRLESRGAAKDAG